jgi:hypothetical protein
LPAPPSSPMSPPSMRMDSDPSPQLDRAV